MALLDLQAMEPAGGYDDCHGHGRDEHCCGSGLSLLLCG
ncbi:MAG TPA: SapB/AmfS family lanthipeptide [Pseudonocardiaceae bacterium]|jgi:hypothetical protein|nr:SapB/AmfS family lanthipeptide [Pseudonocardiaceae bacterium]